MTHGQAETRRRVYVRELVEVVQGCVGVEMLESLEVLVGQTVHRYWRRMRRLGRLRRCGRNRGWGGDRRGRRGGEGI